MYGCICIYVSLYLDIYQSSLPRRRRGFELKPMMTVLPRDARKNKMTAARWSRQAPPAVRRYMRVAERRKEIDGLRFRKKIRLNLPPSPPGSPSPSSSSPLKREREKERGGSFAGATGSRGEACEEPFRACLNGRPLVSSLWWYLIAYAGEEGRI